MYFNSMANQTGQGFTSPGMNPGLLAMLMQMQNGGQPAPTNAAMAMQPADAAKATSMQTPALADALKAAQAQMGAPGSGSPLMAPPAPGARPPVLPPPQGGGGMMAPPNAPPGPIPGLDQAQPGGADFLQQLINMDPTKLKTLMQQLMGGGMGAAPAAAGSGTAFGGAR